MEYLEELDEDEKILFLRVTMEDVRNSWSSPSTRIKVIMHLCETIKSLPAELLAAILNNAREFDGYFVDGRVFRDGQLFLPEDVIDTLGLPEAMKSGVSGNFAKLLGAKNKTNESKYRGTYIELEEFCKLPCKFRPRSDMFRFLVKGYIEYPELQFDDYEGE